MPDKLVIDIYGNKKPLKQTIEEANRDLEKLKNDAKNQRSIDIQLNIAKLQKDIAVAKQQLRSLGDLKLSETSLPLRNKVEELNAKLREARGELAKLDKTAGDSGKGFIRLTRLARDFVSVFVLFQVQDFFKSITVGAFNAAKSFDTAFRGVVKTVGGTQEQLADLERQFRALASGPDSLPLPVEELLRIGELGGQLGIAREELIDFTETIARFAASTNVSADEAATAFARIAEVTGLPAQDFDRFASAVVDLGNNFAANEQEILEFTQRIAGAGAVVGVTTSELAGIATAFTAVGVQAEAGGTAVQKVFLTLNAAVASGGEELEKFAAITQLSTQEFSRLFQEDPTEVFVRFVRGLQSAGKDASSVLGELVGEDVRLQRAFLSVASAGDLLTETLDRQAQAFAQNTALTTESEQRFQSIESRLQRIVNDFKNVAIEIGRVIAKTILPIGEFFAALASDIILATNRLGLFSAAIKTLGTLLLTIGTAKVIGSIGKLSSAFTQGADAIKNIKSASDVASLAMGTLSGAGSKLTKVIIGLVTPMNAFVLAAGALFFAINALNQQEQALLTANQELRDSFAELSSQNASQAIQTLTLRIAELVSVSREARAGVGGIVAPLFDVSERLIMSAQASRDAAINIKLLANEMGFTQKELVTMVPLFFKLQEGVALSDEETKQLAEQMNLLTATFEENKTQVDELARIHKRAGVDGLTAYKKALDEVRDSLDEGADTKKFTRSLIDDLLGNAKEIGNVGTVWGLAIEEGYTSQEIRQKLKDGGVSLSQDVTNSLLAQAVNAGDAGEVYGLLLSLGIKSTEVLNAKTAEEVRNAALNALTNAQAFASAANAAFNNAAAVVSSLVSGILAKIPALENAVNKGLALIDKLTGADTKGFFGGLASFVQRGTTALAGGVKQNLEETKNAIESFDFQTPSLGGGGGGGKGGKSDLEKELEEQRKKEEKALSDFEKAVQKGEERRVKRVAELRKQAAKEAAKQAEEEARYAIEQYEDQLEETTDKIEDLTKRTRELFDEVKEGIVDAKEEQRQLRIEFDETNKENTGEFLTSIGDRAVEVASDLMNAQEELKKLRNESVNTPSEIEKNRESIIKVQEEIRALEEEQISIQEIRNGLTEDEAKTLKEIIDLQTERSKLNDSELLAFDFAREQEANKKAFEEAEAQQLAFIDAQQKLLAILESGDKTSLGVLGDLGTIAELDPFQSEDSILKRLDELGFDGLNIDQAKELLNSVITARDLQVEKDALIAQQQELLNVKLDFNKLFADAFAESVQKQKEETQELINLLNEAATAYRQLNSLSSNFETPSSEVSSQVNNISQTFNVTNSADEERLSRELNRSFPN